MCAAGLLRCRARGYKKGLRRQDRPQRQRRCAPPQHPVPNRMTKRAPCRCPATACLRRFTRARTFWTPLQFNCRRGASDDLEALARATLERQAWWIRALTRVRDVVMATVAVKSSRAVGLAAAARGPVIGFFPVLLKSATELVVGVLRERGGTQK